MPQVGRLTFTGGKLVGQSYSDIWIREPDTVWRQVYKVGSTHAFETVHPPVLQGDYLVFDRNLEESRTRSDAYAITFVDLKNGLPVDIVNQRRDPKVCEMDDIKYKILRLSWESNGVLRVHAKRRVHHPETQTSPFEPISFSYDIASKKWTNLPEQTLDYRLNDPRIFFIDSIPWMIHHGENNINCAKGTFVVHLRPETERGSKARDLLRPIAIPVHFEQASGNGMLLNVGPGERGFDPTITLMCRGGTDWLLWRGSNQALWLCRYDDFMSQLKQLVPKLD
jgi:hypothetical protein